MLVNGLTQYAELWTAYRDALVARQFRVATFDLLGQGASDKPALFINQDDQVEALHRLIGELGDGPVFLSGISFGGLIALRYAIEHGERLAGLVPMSCFAELSPQLLLLGNALRTGLILGGTELSAGPAAADEPVGSMAETAARTSSTRVKRQGWLVNDVYALQNLMESFLDFQPLTPQLSSIGVPTMILNGEFDFLTPAPLHETLRVDIPDSCARHHSERLSRLHAREGGTDGRSARALCRGRAGRTLAGQQDGLDRAGRSRRRRSPRFRQATIICAPSRCRRPTS